MPGTPPPPPPPPPPSASGAPAPPPPPPPPEAPSTWHVIRGGQTYGPYTWEQVVEHTSSGRIGRGDKLFDPRSGRWAKPSKVPGLLGPGGAATGTAGLLTAAKIAVGIVITLALLLASVFVLSSPGPSNTLKWNEGSVMVQEGAANSSTSPTVVMAPEGLAFKGTFGWETKDRDAPNGVLQHQSTCYLWIYTTDEGTAAYFDFGENLRDGYPVQLVTHAGSHYVFRNDNSRVEIVEIVVDVTDTGMSGTVRNTTETISAFVGGTFSGESISYEQYTAEVRSG